MITSSSLEREPDTLGLPSWESRSPVFEESIPDTDVRYVVQRCIGFLKCSFEQQMVGMSADSYQLEICSPGFFNFFHKSDTPAFCGKYA
jgi:hypothetical protein